MQVPESEGLGTGSSHALPCPWQEKTEVPAQEGRKGLPFLCFFVLFGPSVVWMLPACTEEGRAAFLSLRTQLLISFRNTLRGTPRNHVVSALWASLRQADT